MNIEALKILAAIFSVIGSGVLAFRVTGILAALSLVANCHEVNIKNLASRDDGSGAIYLLNNTTAHIEKAQKRGLLIFGFACIVISAILQLLALVITSGDVPLV